MRQHWQCLLLHRLHRQYARRDRVCRARRVCARQVCLRWWRKGKLLRLKRRLFE